MKILISTDLFEPSVNGVVTSVLNLKKGLEAKGHKVKILTLSPNHHSFRRNGVYYIGSVNTDIVYPGTHFRIRYSQSLKLELIHWCPDVVHSQCEFSTFGMARKIAMACNAPLIHTYHTVYEDYTHYFCPIKPLGRHMVSEFTKHRLNRTDAVIVPSQKVAGLLKRYHVSVPLAIIPTGINLSTFSSASSEQLTDEKLSLLKHSESELNLIFIGRLAKEKNIEELLHLIAECFDIPLKFIIVGDGPEKNTLIKLCSQLNIEDRVIFTGMVPSEDVSRYYRLGDVFVNASNSETQGLTYMEAMASGLPLLCKRDACLNGLIIDGINGWQYESRKDFHEHLYTLFNDRNLRDKLSKNSAEMSKNFSVENFVNRVEKLYLKTLRTLNPFYRNN